MASSTDIVTLENFEAKMPKWRPNLPNYLYALVDMGSNGIRFSISDLAPPHARLLKCLYRERAAISLFDALNSAPSDGPLLFPEETISLVAQTLARFRSIANDFQVPPEHISVFATEAMRKADNAAAMLDAVKAASGLGVYVLTPQVETLFGAMGARSGFAEVDGVFLDLGGGSVQMTYMNSALDGYELAAAQSGESLPFGAARLTNILERGEKSARVTAEENLHAGMIGAYATLQQKFAALRDLAKNPNNNGVDVFLCGGGFRGYGSMLMHNDPVQPYPIPAIGAYKVGGKLFGKVKAMSRVNQEYDGKIFGMSKRRRQQFPAIATVIKALADAVPNIRSVTFCSGGNREGALLLRLPKDVREAKPLPLLRCPTGHLDDAMIQCIVASMISAVPMDLDISRVPTVFTLGLSSLFAGRIWKGIGEPSEANAAYELHYAVTRDSGVPGFTHLARAVLGLTLCARWGSSLGPSDQALYHSLRELLFNESPEASFWSDYFGAIAALLATVCPAEPTSFAQLSNTVQFNANLREGKSKSRIELMISLSPRAAQGLDIDRLVDMFTKLGNPKKATCTIDRKVETSVNILSSSI